MDTGEYETNTLLINYASSVVYRFYEPSPDLSQGFVSAALDIESALRYEGHFVSYDATRRGIWYFRLLHKEGQPDGTDQGLQPSIQVAGYSLVAGEEGTIEPPILQKARSQTHQSNNTPTSSSSTGSALEQAQRHAPVAPLQGTVSNPQDQDPKGAHHSGIDSKSGSTPQKTVYENFIASILLTISVEFCRQAGAIPLNYRTVLFPPGSSSVSEPQADLADKSSILGTFRAYLTTTGALIVSLALSRCKGLLSLEGAVASSLTPTCHRILAAPFGIMTSRQLNAAGDGGTASLAQTPNTQILSLRGGPEVQDSLWKQACLKFLEIRGIATSKLGDCPWVNLLISRPRHSDPKNDHRLPGSSSLITLPWPGRLCFRKRGIDISSTSRMIDTVLSGHEESHDPLGNAKGWFTSAVEREEKMSKRTIERAAAIPKEAITTDPRAPKPNGYCPVMLRRPSTAAAGIMYPTPPDGVQQPNGVTPSIDGTLSPPGNPLTAPVAADMEAVGASTTSNGDSLDEDAMFAEAKRLRPENNLLLGCADNMFEDMFDDNDITEADFNFFDERPGDIDLDITMSDLAAPESVPLPLPQAAQEAPKAMEEETIPQPPPQQDTAVFAKPELKHARSCQSEDQAQRSRETRSTGSTKRESSPFDPHTVFKRVRASLRATGRPNVANPAVNRKSRVFERIEFDPALPMMNRKYERGGLFDYSTTANTEKPKLDMGILPETDYLKRHGRSNRKPKERPGPLGSLMKTLTVLEPQTSTASPTKMDGSVSDVDDSSMESDQDDSSYTTEEPTSPQKVSVKLAHVEDDAMSQVTSLRETETIEEPDHQLAVELPRLSKPDASEVPLSLFFSDPEPLALDMALTDEDVVQIAQILTEQAATGSLDICDARGDGAATVTAGQKRQVLSTHNRNAFHILEAVVSQLLGETTPMRLKGLLDVQDVPLLGQPTRLQPRQIPGREANPEPVRNLYQIPSPHLEIRRADVKLSVLPSAVTFWESLGLAPSSGSKNVSAICVFPGWAGMGDSVRTFLGRIKSVYEVLKLGTFESMPIAPDFEDGLLPYEVDRISTSPDATITGHGSSLIEVMEVLRGALSNLTITETNFIIYFVYSPKNPGTIIEACTAFQRFFESYQKLLATRRETARNDLVLQLVSVDVISSPTSMVMTPAPELVKLCIEAYDRCTMFSGPMPAPAIRLEQPLPRIIDFKLTMTPSASLIRENSNIHVSYAQSVDDRWVTAAWTDDRGDVQATASYCLGRKGKSPSRSMGEIANEIWETTLELISSWKVHWRIIITKCGPMYQHEMEFWVDLARTEINAMVSMILMTVDTNPSLQLLAPVVKLPSSSAPLHATPVSTPQANMVSPEQTTTPATPSGEGAADADSESVLADITDQTWGAVVGHRLSNSTSVLEVQPALISGYLIKRTGTRVEDAPVVMEVNLVHTDAMPRAYEPLLREILSYFRGLGTLARARGVVDREADVRPWHVAAAEKAVRALYLLM